MVRGKKPYPKYEYRIVWKREGWTSPMERRFAKIETVLKHLERLETAKTWERGERPLRSGINADGDYVEDEGPWDVEPLVYAKVQRRLVERWEEFPIESSTASSTGLASTKAD